MKQILRKEISLLFCLMLCLCVQSKAHAVSGVWGNLNWSFNSASGGLEVSGTGAMNDFSSAYSGGWHSYYDRITSVTIGPGITSIGSLAFRDCASLASVTLPDSLTSIGFSAFNGCRSLQQFTMPNSVVEVGNSAFGRCSSLRDITISNNLTAINYAVFNQCTSLTTVAIPDGVTSIGMDAFNRCTSLTRIDLPASVHTIGDYAFQGCGNLTGIWAAENSTTFRSDSFGVLYSKSGNQLVAAPGKLSSTYHIPSTTTSIAAFAFSDCKSLMGVSLSENLTTIPDGLFYECSSLKSVMIPKNVKSVGSQAFYNCTSLTDVYYDGYSFQNVKIDANYNDALSSATIHYIPGFGNAYNLFWILDENGLLTLSGSGEIDDRIGRNSTAWRSNNCYSKVRQVMIEPGITSIGEKAFWNLNLTDVTIPNTVRTIGGNAFNNCRSLTSINIPEGVVTIGNYAFSSCSKLRSIVLPESVTSIGEGAFSECAALTGIWASENSLSFFSDDKGVLYNIEQTVLIQVPGKASGVFQVPGFVAEVGAAAFQGCMAISDIELQPGVRSIGEYAFWGCGLKTISIPLSLTEIGHGAFAGCSSLTDVYFEGSQNEWNNITIGNDNAPLSQVTYHYAPLASGIWDNLAWTLEADGFLTISGTGTMKDYPVPLSTEQGWHAYADDITAVFIEEGVTSIGENAFNGHTQLAAITIPDSVRRIGEAAFFECHSLTEITISDSVTYIGVNAFYGCDQITTINYGGSRHQWNQLIAEGTLSQAELNCSKADLDLVTDNGSDVISVVVTKGELASRPEDPVREGYDFLGWFEAGAEASFDFENTRVYDDIILTARWNAHTYEVRFDANGGEGVPEPQIKIHGTDLSLSSIQPVHETGAEGNYIVALNANGGTVTPDMLSTKWTINYSFKDWNTEEAGTGVSYTSGAVYAENAAVTLYAQWEAAVSAESVSLPVPVRDGYNFLGWSTGNNTESGISGDYIPTGNVMLYAQWERKGCTVSFDTNGGSRIESLVVDPGATVMRPIPPEKDGFWFGGWYTDFDLVNAFDFNLPVSEDITLYAKWVVPDFMLPESLQSIEEEGFAGCTFTFVMLPGNAVTICKNAFADCENLAYIYISENTTDIDPQAFGNISDLTIFGEAGSRSEDYANEHGFVFCAVSDDHS